jgi:hypothetical protein
MKRNRTLSPFERVVALCLSLAWMGGGALASYFALIHSRWVIGAAALGALLYGAAWLRVAATSRLLTWAELTAPWRRQRG